MHPEDLKTLNRFSLYRETALSEMTDSSDNLLNIIKCTADQVADRYFCRITLAHRKLIPVRAGYLEDLQKIMLDSDLGTKELDHFKHAAILSYWLCKHKPVHEVSHATIKRYDESEDISLVQRQRLWGEFDSFHDELIAFFFGFHICNSHHLQKLAAKNPSFRTYVEAQSDHFGLTRLFEPDALLLHDIVRIMHDNHMGIYALYLLYKTMFEHAPNPRWIVPPKITLVSVR